MSSDLTEHYDAFPYPERDPADEKKRLITGSPSHPFEIDHFLYGGLRDWRRPFRVLVAGGGTGDGLIQLAHLLAQAGRPYHITYLDLSTKARAIAEARAAMRGLTDIEFVTGSLMDAEGMGPFDYIDCCGVLHHLDAPAEGLKALASALSERGGMGLMLYAPYGRSGVYPLQEAFGRLLHGRPAERLRKARAIFDRVPAGHPFKRNTITVDHKDSPAGFYDLLLHGQDRAYTIREVFALLDEAGLCLTGMPQAFLYDPTSIVGEAALLHGIDEITRMELAEKLRGTIKTHIFYVAKDTQNRLARADRQAVPHLKGVPGPKLAKAAAETGVISLSYGALKADLPVSVAAARCLAEVDGRRTLAEIAERCRLDPVGFFSIWVSMAEQLTQFGVLLYSRIYRNDRV